MADDFQITADYSDLQLMRRELLGVSKDAKQSAGVFAREYAKVERQIQKTAKANQDYHNNLLKVDRTTKSAAQSASVFSRSLDKNTQDFKRLKAAIDPTYAAHQRLIRVKKVLRAELVAGNISMEEAVRLMRQSSVAGVGNTKSMNALGMGMQQTGYQVGDFLVQVQSGTNAMVAFGQQATQLVGILPMFADRLGVSATRMIAISAGLGIAIPLLTAFGAYFMRASGSGKTFSDTLTELTDVISAYDDQVDIATQSTEELYKTFGDQAERIREIAKAIATIQKIEAIDAINDSLTSLSETLQVGWIDSLKGFAQNSEGELRKIANEFELTRDKAKEVQRVFKDFSSAEGIDGAVTAATNLYDTLLRVFGSAQNIPPELREAFINAGKLAQEAAKAGDEAERFRGIVSDTDLSGLSSQAKLLAQFMGFAADEAERYNAALNAAAGMSDVTPSSGRLGFGIEGSVEGPFNNLGFGNLNSGLRNKPTPLPDSNSSGGSSGGSSSGDRVGALAQSLLTEREMLEVWWDESLEKLKEFNAKELEILGGQAEAKALIEQEYQDRLRDIKAAERKETTDIYASIFSSMASIAGSGGKKLLKIQAGLSAASTMISAYEAAASAAAKAPTIEGKFAVWAAFVAKGVAAVAQIRSLGDGGSPSGGGGGGGAGAIATPEARTAPQRVLIEGLSPTDMISGEMLQQLFDSFYDENDERGQVFLVSR